MAFEIPIPYTRCSVHRWMKSWPMKFVGQPMATMRWAMRSFRSRSRQRWDGVRCAVFPGGRRKSVKQMIGRENCCEKPWSVP